MKALVFERSLARFAAARVAGTLAPGAGSRVGPLRLVDTDEPSLPGPDWHRVRPLLAGICGSDLATIDGRASRYFEDIVSFPFTPGHEVVGILDDGTRVVVEPVLGCAARGITPLCAACARGDTGGCQQLAFGHLAPGLQTGYCADTGGGWSGALVAHASQLHPVPDALSDETAVMVEPTACAVHAALAASAAGPAGTPGSPGSVGPPRGSAATGVTGATIVVLGAGTLGLCTVAALRSLAVPGAVIAVAKHSEQHAMARELGASVVAAPDEVGRAVRRATRSMAIGRAGADRLTGGADVVVDCVGSAESLATALEVVAPRGRVVMVGMPGRVSVDLTPLWHREVALVGAYAYGVEEGANGQRTFDVALDLVADAGLGRLVSALYPLDRYAEAIEHAATAGRRGAVKVAFDLRGPARR